MIIKTYKEALEKIFQIEETRDYSLERVKKAIKILNNPLKNIKIIHITGTN
jgi:folylpolyglutamate synthase/dihydropteroate synthase